MKKTAILAALLLAAPLVSPLAVSAGFNSVFSDPNSHIEVLTPAREAPAIAAKSTDSVAIWAFYGTAGESEHWNKQLKEVFGLAFDSAKVDPCNYKSDCEGPPSKFENERWVVRVILKDLRNDRKDSSNQSYYVEGTGELFDYGKSVKTWDFNEELKVKVPIFGGLSSNDHKAAQGPLAHNTGILLLETVWKEVQLRDKAGADSSAFPKVFVGNFRGSASMDMVTAVEDAFVAAVSESGTHTALTEADAKAMLNSAALQQMLGCDNESCMANIGQLVGAANVIHGSVAVSGADLQITASYIDSKAGKILKRTRRTLPNKLGVIPGAAKSMFKELVR